MSIIINFYIIIIGTLYILYKKMVDKKATERSERLSLKKIELSNHIMRNYFDDYYHTIEKDIRIRLDKFYSVKNHLEDFITDKDMYTIYGYYKEAKDIQSEVYSDEYKYRHDISEDCYIYSVMRDIVMAIEYKKIPNKRCIVGYPDEYIALFVKGKINSDDIVLCVDTNVYNNSRNVYIQWTIGCDLNEHSVKRGFIKREYI